jgi:hypothetical protein
MKRSEPPTVKSWIAVLAELDRLTLQRDELIAQLWDAEAELKKFRNELAAARLERDNARCKVVSLR